MLQMLGDTSADVADLDKFVATAWSNYNDSGATPLSSVYGVAWQDPTGAVGPADLWRVIIADDLNMPLTAYVTTQMREGMIEYPWVGLTLREYFQTAQAHGISVTVRQYSDLAPPTSVGVDVTL